MSTRSIVSPIFEKTGQVTFSVDGRQRSHNYRVSTNAEKLFMWFEDTTTKEQWQTNELLITDFVTLDTVIPMAKTKDYAQRVVECFGKTDAVTGELKPSRSLSMPAADGSRVLFVSFPLAVGTFSTSLEYTFTLAKVPLNPVDLLAARMLDMEVRLTAVEAENTALKTRLEKLEKAK